MEFKEVREAIEKPSNMALIKHGTQIAYSSLGEWTQFTEVKNFVSGVTKDNLSNADEVASKLWLQLNNMLHNEMGDKNKIVFVPSSFDPMVEYEDYMEVFRLYEKDGKFYLRASCVFENQ